MDLGEFFAKLSIKVKANLVILITKPHVLKMYKCIAYNNIIMIFYIF